ncbi:MAG: TlpA family protein disulfide reductase [Candidatus Eremiobacteraeota bacterium]|nr:TlpA family protein disulfide reductase [Candidatus Eremiobacteraeota bacterium]
MKTLAVALLITALAALPAAAAAPPRPGTPAPTFKLKTVDGKPLALEQYKGKPVYLDFFASWCAPCRDETPGIIKLSKQYAKKGLVVIGLDDQEISDRATGFRDDFKIKFPVGIADQKTLDSYGVIALPVHVFIDRKGIIKTYRLGEMSYEEIETAIKSIV